jgi:RHS repeat-associated protein
MTYPSGKIVDYARDAQGRVSQVSLRNNAAATPTVLASSFVYEPMGPLKSFSYSNTLTFNQDWGSDRRLYGKFIKRADTTNLWGRTYTYDNDDTILRITAAGGPRATMNFTYDAKSRLSRATGGFATVAREDYQYDDNDNRTVLEQRTSTTATTPSLTAASTITPGTNRLASITTTTSTGSVTRALSYNGRGDIAGELRDALPVTTSYDAYVRLTGYTRSGTPNAATLYSGTDERVQVTLGTTPRRFVHDESGRVIGEYGATGTVFAEHVWLMPDSDEGGWEPLALLGASTLSYVHGDHLGVPVVITNTAGTSINDMQADPFGRRFRTASASQPRSTLAFPGQIIDIADRHYNLYRDYDPTLGRYLQADPIGLEGGDIVYSYVGGNPVNAIDPEGLLPKFDLQRCFGNADQGNLLPNNPICVSQVQQVRNQKLCSIEQCLELSAFGNARSMSKPVLVAEKGDKLLDDVPFNPTPTKPRASRLALSGEILPGDIVSVALGAVGPKGWHNGSALWIDHQSLEKRTLRLVLRPLACWRRLLEPPLHLIPQHLIGDGLMLSIVDLAFVDNLPSVNRVLEQVEHAAPANGIAVRQT